MSSQVPVAADVRFDDDGYSRLVTLDPVLRSIAQDRGRPDPFTWVGGGVGLPYRTYATTLLWASLSDGTDH